MKILIIDDDEPKKQAIREFLLVSCPKAEVIEKNSYQSGMKALFTGEFDLVVLDMSLPTYDPSTVDPRGGRPRAFGGLDILKELKRKAVKLPVVVITQFSILREGEAEERTFKELAKLLKDDFSEVCLGAIYYKHSESEWQQHLEKYIKDLF